MASPASPPPDKSGKVNINGFDIYHEIRGTGDHIVLLLPGAMGTCSTDYVHQYKGFDLKQFTLVCWDPPGYGNSRPPSRYYGNYYIKDRDNALQLMKQLGYDKYSVVGFSDGGRTGLMMAAKSPETITKAIAWGCNCFITEQEKRVIRAIQSIKGWSEDVKKPLIAIYGNDLQTIWDNLTQVWLTIGDNLFKDDLPLIKCPVFILHGDKDPMVLKSHPGYFKTHISKCRVHHFPFEGHNLQQTAPVEFNRLVQEFLLA